MESELLLASRRSILQLVVRQGMLLVLIGTTAGLGSGIAAAQLLKRVLFRVDPSEPGTFALVILVWVVVALLACYVPARRAAKVDSMVASRNEVDRRCKRQLVAWWWPCSIHARFTRTMLHKAQSQV